jgi:nucleoside-diphosphate-sugar epimerase
MIDADHCAYTLLNNVIGTLNLLHAIREEIPQPT